MKSVKESFKKKEQSKKTRQDKKQRREKIRKWGQRESKNRERRGKRESWIRFCQVKRGMENKRWTEWTNEQRRGVTPGEKKGQKEDMSVQPGLKVYAVIDP